MIGERVGPDRSGIRAKVSAQNSLKLQIVDITTVDCRKHVMGIFCGHLLELAIAASVTVEGNALKKCEAFFIDVEICKHAPVLEA